MDIEEDFQPKYDQVEDTVVLALGALVDRSLDGKERCDSLPLRRLSEKAGKLDCKQARERGRERGS